MNTLCKLFVQGKSEMRVIQKKSNNKMENRAKHFHQHVCLREQVRGLVVMIMIKVMMMVLLLLICR